MALQTGPLPTRVELAGPLRIVGPAVTVDGGSLGSRRAGVAFARLALDAGRTVPRDALADAVWGEDLPRTWQPALRNAIAAIRELLDRAGLDGAATLRALGDGYRLDLPPDTIVDIARLERDVVAAQDAARAGDHSAALVIAREGLETAARPVLAGAEGDWVDTLRARVAELREWLLRIAAESALATADWADAERVARTLVAVRPLREDGHRLLMRALHAAGNTGAALSHYEVCRRVLSDELGAVPSAATEELFLQLLREERQGGGNAEPRGAVAGALLLVGRQVPFVGRTAELEHLLACLGPGDERGPRVVGLSGEPGIGKTRLAAELAARAHAAGLSVLYGRGDDRALLPHRPFLEAVDHWLSAFEPHETARLLGAHADVLGAALPWLTPTPPGPGGWPAGLVAGTAELTEAVLHALRVAAGRRGALLVLDDMHRAGEPSLAALDAVARGAGLAGLVVLVVHGDRDDRVARRAALSGSRADHVALGPLDVPAVAALAAGLGADEGEAAARRVHRAAGGNPLLARDLIVEPGPGLPLSRRVTAFVGERLAALPPAAEAVLGAAAVAGPVFDAAPVIAATPSVTPADGRSALRAARRCGLLLRLPGAPERLTFRHTVVRDALLSWLDPGERMRIAQRLGTGGGPFVPEDAGLGDWRAARRYGLRVAREAAAAGEHEDVVAVGSRALARLELAGDPDPEARVDLEVLLGGALRALGRDRGDAVLHAALATARSRDDARRVADAALAFAIPEDAYVDDRVLPVYEEALRALGNRDPARRARLLGHVATAHAWLGSGAAARTAAAAALSLLGGTAAGPPGFAAPPHGAGLPAGDATRAAVLASVRRALGGGADPATQEPIETELLTLAERLDDPGLRARARLWRFATAVEAGHPGLETWLDAAAADVARGRAGAHHHVLAVARAALALLRGRVAEADVLVERAAAAGRGHGVPETVIATTRLAQLLEVRREQGRLAELEADVVQVFGAAGVPEWRGVVAAVHAELGDGDGDGDGDGVAGDLDACLAGFATGGPRIAASVGLLAGTAPAVARLGDPDRAATAYELLAPWSGRGAHGAVFAGPVDHALGVLAAARDRPRDARRHLTAAVVFSDRLGAPLWAGRSRAVLADV